MTIYRFTRYNGDIAELSLAHDGFAISIVEDSPGIAYVTDTDGNFIHGDVEFHSR